MTFTQAKKAAELMEERAQYEKFLDILKNYDSKLQVTASSFHNDNRKTYVEKSLMVDTALQDAIIQFVEDQLAAIDAEIKNL
jgi:hypothetical protein